MAIANTGFVDVVAYYGDATSCRKHKLHPMDWKAAQKAPDAAKWALSAQSGTVVDVTRNPETCYAACSPSNANGVYPFPTGGL
jgi:hypothetical protein